MTVSVSAADHATAQFAVLALIPDDSFITDQDLVDAVTRQGIPARMVNGKVALRSLRKAGLVWKRPATEPAEWTRTPTGTKRLTNFTYLRQRPQTDKTGTRP